MLVVLPGCGGGGTGHGQPNSQAGAQKSFNWSGYQLSGTVATFSRVSGTWNVPAVDCSGDPSTTSATWTGIGGGTSSTDPTLIQAGTEQDCNGGASYSAWWEAFPAPSVPAGGPLSTQTFPVQPGDQVTVTIDGSSAAVWSISIENATQGWSFNTTVPFSGATLSAEWIMEDPLSAGTGGPQEPLSNFGRMSFFMLSANGANPMLTPDERIEMENLAGDVIATPSDPATGGDAFDVCFGSGACR